MQTPSSIFNTRREAAANHITQKCVIEVGNYALASKGASVTASSEFSADWPAAAVVNGDKTHINAGAAGAAENGIGGAVWQSANAADGSGNISEWLLLDLGVARRVNRIKLIFWPENTKNGNLGAIGPKDFLIETWDGSLIGFGEGGFGGGVFGGGVVFSAWSGLVDKCAEIDKDAVTISAGQVTGNTNDMVVFEDPTAQTVQQIKITISKLQAASVRARVVAVEVTLAVDVSDAVVAVSRSRKKDYHLERRQSTQLQITLRNPDGRFNDKITPTSAQVLAGWFNSLIRPNLEIRYYAGFSGENVQMFTGSIDSWEPDSESRLVKLQARDFYKFLIKPKISTKLKNSWSLEALVELVANYQNYPSNLMTLDTTTISPAYFMPKDKTIQQVLNDIQDATGDSELYFDEFGGLHFRSYLTVISHVWFVSSQADFAAGTNVDGQVDTSAAPLKLATSAPGVYYKEGNWYSALSPTFPGKVEFTTFLASSDVGTSGSVDLFMRVTNDGGSTFTPWREILPGGKESKWNHYYAQVQIWAKLRTGDTSQTPKLLDFTVKYRSRGGSNMVNQTADWATKDTTTLLGMKRKITDQVGGANYLISRSIVKSKPTFASSGTSDAWQGTNNGNTISGSNPLFVPVGTTVIQVDFGDTQFDVPQTVVITWGSAVGSTSLSSSPNKPTLTITATTAGTITALKITGTPFVQSGIVEAIVDSTQEIKDDYGVNEDTLENDYIDNVDLATDIATNLIQKFGRGPLDWIEEAPIRFSPNAQLNDRVTVTDRFSGVATDYVIIGLVDELIANSDKTCEAKTKGDLVKIGENGYAQTVPAYYGGGAYYYDNFRFGGNGEL